MRLIDADVLSQKWKEVLEEKADEKGSVAYLTFELFIEKLAGEPTIDAVPVVRCKDCRYAQPTIDGCWVCSEATGREYVGEEHFCSYGEPRDGE